MVILRLWGRMDAKAAFILKPDEEKYCGGLTCIGAGLARTGTSSLKAALTILQGNPTYHMNENVRNGDSQFWFEAAVDGKTDKEWREFMRCYGGSTDLPACIHWKALLKAYPDAKVILTTRSPDSWYESCKETIFKTQPGNVDMPLGIWLYQNLMPFGPGRAFKKMMTATWNTKYFKGDYSKENSLQIFQEWNSSVVEECPRDKLLIHDAKDGWAPLCAFLGVPIPEIPYPHLNDTTEMKTKVWFANITGYIVVTLMACGVVTGGVAVMNMQNRKK
jgi:hypothetical protein